MKLIKTDNNHMAFADNLSLEASSMWFNIDYWRDQDLIQGSSQGRNCTWFVRTPQDGDWVLRHYYRGGLMAKLSQDSYFFCGLNKTRAMAEFNLLETLYKEGFPVPRPIAANVVRHGLCYRADLIIKRIDGAEDLVAKLSREAMAPELWYRLGQCIARFHRRGVYHADLNAKNILLAEEQFYLIDFDRGAIRTASPAWQQANLKRLLRSFNKEQKRQPSLAFNEENWQQLTQGYQSYS